MLYSEIEPDRYVVRQPNCGFDLHISYRVRGQLVSSILPDIFVDSFSIITPPDKLATGPDFIGCWLQGLLQGLRIGQKWKEHRRDSNIVLYVGRREQRRRDIR